MTSYSLRYITCGLCQRRQRELGGGGEWGRGQTYLDGHSTHSSGLRALGLNACGYCPYVAENLARRPRAHERLFFLAHAEMPALERAAACALEQGDASLAWRAYREAAWEHQDRLRYLRLLSGCQRTAAERARDAAEEAVAERELHRLRGLALSTLRPLVDMLYLPESDCARVASQALVLPEPVELERLIRQAWRAVALTELVRRQGAWEVADECEQLLLAAQRAVAGAAALAAAAHPASLTLDDRDPAAPLAAAQVPVAVRQRAEEWLCLRDVLNLQLRLLRTRQQSPATVQEAEHQTPDHARREAARAAAEAVRHAEHQARKTAERRAVAPQTWADVLQTWLDGHGAMPAKPARWTTPQSRWTSEAPPGPLRRAARVVHALLKPAAMPAPHPVDAALAARTPAEAEAAWRLLPLSDSTIGVLLACERYYAWPLGSVLPALALALRPVLPRPAATLARFAELAAARGQVPPPELVAYLTRALANSTPQAWYYAAPKVDQDPRNAPPTFTRVSP